MKRVVPSIALSWTHVVVAVILGLYCGGSALIAASGYGSAVSTVSAHLNVPPPATPVAYAAQIPEPLDGMPIWGDNRRVNILLLGSDARPGEEGAAPRTDIVAVATIDPVTRSAGLISFPRDLLVTIPIRPNVAYQERINTAYHYGELEGYPGGGIALAQRTIELNFGIPTTFWVLVDFEGVVQLIDLLGGVTVDVQAPLKDDEYPTQDYRTQRIYIPPGLQHLNGSRALEYARSRHQDSDFQRNQRQQQVLLALRDRALATNMLFNAPALLAQANGTFKTNMQPTQMIALARLGTTIDRQDITVKALDERSATPTNYYGASVLQPNRLLISQAIAEVFGDPRIRREAAQVVILATPDLRQAATRMAATLTARGLNVQVADTTAVGERSTILSDTKAATAAYIAGILKLPAVAEPPWAGDVTIVLGPDSAVLPPVTS